MADFVYDKGRQKFLEGSIAWLTANLKVVLVDGADYSPSQSADEFLAAVAAGGRVATSGNFTTPTSTAGVADADDVTFTTVSGDQSEMLVIYKDTADPATSPLICKVDSYNGLPITPNGGNITLTWPNDANKIFKL